MAGTATAHGPFTMTGAVVAPGTVEISGVGNPGAFFCQNVMPALPAFCSFNGLGGMAFDVSAVDDPSINHYHPFAHGTCSVHLSTPSLGQDYFWICATDRNDDGIIVDGDVACSLEDDAVPHLPWGVTNHDECTGEVGFAGSVEDHPDDWVDGCYRHGFAGPTTCSTTGNSDSRPFCFQDDVTEFTAPTSDDTGQPGDDISAWNNRAGGSFDEVFFFVGVPSPNTAMSVGIVAVTLTIEGAAWCGIVSAHSTPGNTRTRANGWGWSGCPPGGCGAGDP